MRGAEYRLQTLHRSMPEGVDGFDSLVQFGGRLFAGHASEQAVDDFPLSGRQRLGSNEDIISTRIVVAAECARIAQLRLGTEVAGSKLLPPCPPLCDVPAHVTRNSQEPAAYRRPIPQRLDPSPRGHRRHLDDVFGFDRPTGVGVRNPEHSSAVFRQRLAQQFVLRVRTGHRVPPLLSTFAQWNHHTGLRQGRQDRLSRATKADGFRDSWPLRPSTRSRDQPAGPQLLLLHDVD